MITSAIILFILANPFQVIAGHEKDSNKLEAQIVGDTSFGTAGKKAILTLRKNKCEVESIGDSGVDGQAPKIFKIVFACEGRKQVLWDISNPSPDDFSFDDPQFSLLWAGDQDADGKIDVKMDMSPKYSCTKEVLYLSTKAKPGDLLGVSGNPKNECGK